VLGIILGISILITVISVMNGFEKELKDKVLGFTSHVTAYTNNLDRPDFDIFDELMQKREILGYSPYLEKEVLLSSKHSTTNSFIRIVDPILEKSVGYTHHNIILGNYDSLSDISNTIILGSGVASKLNVDIDDEIEVYTQFKHSSYKKMIQFKQKYRVAGIFDIGIYEYNNAYAFLNLSEFLAILQQNNKRDIFADRVRIKLSDPLNSRSFTSEFNRNNNEFFAQDWSYTHKSLFTAINNEKRVMFIILMLIVAVAAFNIISSLLMLVTNKEKEIAVLVTLGATKKDMIYIFLLQGLFLGVIGIIFGVLFGILLANNIDLVIRYIEALFNTNLMPADIYHLSKIPSLIIFNDIILIIIFTFFLTLISAIYPAIKASQVKPSVVFRGNN
tara:strand:- start:2446 stop:3612 length:1167 start_codon:yes stop_codon:yes gene_type:complete